jgi:hypothetical protein
MQRWFRRHALSARFLGIARKPLPGPARRDLSHSFQQGAAQMAGVTLCGFPEAEVDRSSLRQAAPSKKSMIN